MPRPSIVEFVTGPQLLGVAVSPAQETLLPSIYGLPLDAEQLALWSACTGRDSYPAQPFGEITVAAGARGGKDSRIACPIAISSRPFPGSPGSSSSGSQVPSVRVSADREQPDRSIVITRIGRS